MTRGAPLKEANATAQPAAANDQQPPLRTFSRKARLAQIAEVDSETQLSPSTPLSAASRGGNAAPATCGSTISSHTATPSSDCSPHPSSHPQQASAISPDPEVEKNSKGGKAGLSRPANTARAYPRRAVRGVHALQAEQHRRFVEDMSKHFQEVDAFELMVESPGPPSTRKQNAHIEPNTEQEPSQLEPAPQQPAASSVSAQSADATAPQNRKRLSNVRRATLLLPAPSLHAVPEEEDAAATPSSPFQPLRTAADLQQPDHSPGALPAVPSSAPADPTDEASLCFSASPAPDNVEELQVVEREGISEEAGDDDHHEPQCSSAEGDGSRGNVQEVQSSGTQTVVVEEAPADSEAPSTPSSLAPTPPVHQGAPATGLLGLERGTRNQNHHRSYGLSRRSSISFTPAVMPLPASLLASRARLSLAPYSHMRNPAWGVATEPATPALPLLPKPGGCATNAATAPQCPLYASTVLRQPVPLAAEPPGVPGTADDYAQAGVPAGSPADVNALTKAAEQLLLASPEAQSPDVFANLAACTPAPQAGPAWALDEDHDHFGEDDARGGMEVSIHGLPPLQQLLHICGQVGWKPIPSMAEVVAKYSDGRGESKLGEGTYGEAFRVGGKVLKVVPLEGALVVNGEQQLGASDLLGETTITLTLSALRRPDGDCVTNAFVEAYGVEVCCSSYAPQLIQAAQEWARHNVSENDPLDLFPADQLYVAFVVADGGCDLERFDIRHFDEARSLLLQAVVALAVAEAACQFEHRDLHWGNVLLRRGAPATTHARLRGVDMELDTSGVQVTLIDFTLSRLSTLLGRTAFNDLAADPALFAGPKGDVQAETYRRMKKATRNRWDEHCPATNCLWMHYLADIIVTAKHHCLNREHKALLRSFRKQALVSKSCNELLFDNFFKGCWRTTS